ncbi:MAG: HAMP domain-containing protein, partial [Nitrospina sp.]|nr:HAMP domain-containing protein [Nitrospina sp.]
MQKDSIQTNKVGMWGLKQKISFLLILVGLTPFFIFYFYSSEKVTELILHTNKDRLVSLRETKKIQIENYFKNIASQATTFSKSYMVVDAMDKFNSSFSQVEQQTVSTDTVGLKNKLTQRYIHQQQNTPGSSGNAVDRWIPQGKASQILQKLYIADNPNPIGEKHKLDVSNDRTMYSQIHQQYHTPFRQYLEEFGYYDIFLVDADTGFIVYSVFKEVDFATNLKSGPYKDTGIGRVFQKALAASSPDTVVIEDFSPYEPSYNASAAFIASPIYDMGEISGVLIFQAPVDRINDVMTSGNDWKGVGLGDSGEVYLVGQDFKMRNNSRFLIEAPDEYFKFLTQLGVDASSIKKQKALNTNIGISEVKTPGSIASLSGKTNFEIFPDYRGVPVLSAYAPVDILGLKWGILSEIDESEAFAVQKIIQKASIYLGSGLAVGILIIALIFATSFSKRIRELATSMRKIADGDLRSDPLQITSKDELGQLRKTYNDMSVAMQNIASQAGDIATGSLDKEYDLKGELAESFETMVNSLREKEKADAEMARIAAIVENNPSNMMVANTDLVITYMNPVSKQTLKSIEQYLPIKVDDMLDQSIDIFHKNPSLQRKILSDPKNLPHNAQIQVGPEILDLRINAIVDKNGTYLGPLVDWALATERVKLENDSKERANQEKKAAEELQVKVDSMLTVVQAASEGDLTQEITVNGNSAIGQMGAGLKKFLSGLRSDIGSISQNAESVSAAAEELTATSTTMSANAEETSAQAGVVASASEEVGNNVQTVATGAEEMSSSISEIANNSTQAAQISNEAVEVAKRTNITITTLGESSKEIGEVVKVITSIAEQTN